MFLCQLCGVTVAPRIRAARIAVSRRSKMYPFRSDANVFYRPDLNGKVKEFKSDDPGGVGWEIAREVLACPTCAEQFLATEGNSNGETSSLFAALGPIEENPGGEVRTEVLEAVLHAGRGE